MTRFTIAVAFSFVPSLVFAQMAAPTTLVPSAASAPAGNDLRSKVLFKLDVNYQLADAEVTGEPPLAARRANLPAGDAQAAALHARADFLSSDHVLGTEGLGWSHLRMYFNGFLLHRFQSFDGAPSPVWPTAYLRGREQTHYDVRAGYAELNGFKNDGFWSKVFVRAGRQFRYGAGIATFDGATLGYQGPGVELALWGGRRSPRFLDDLDPGYVAGVDAVLHLDPLARAPVDLGANYLVFVDAAGPHHLLMIDGRWRMRSGGRFLFSFSSYDFSGVRAHLGLTHPLGRSANFKAYYDVKLGRDLTYDFVAGFGMAPSRYFTLPELESRSRLGVRVDHAIGRHFEYALYGNFNLVHPFGTVEKRGWTGATAFDAFYEELGAAARVNLPRAFVPEAEYRIRLVQRFDESGLFSDSSQAGERQFQEVRGSLRVRPLDGLAVIAGAMYRIWDFTTRYAALDGKTVSNDTTVAGEFSVEYWIKRHGLLRVRYEIGLDSRAFAPELGLVQTLYATVGGKL